MPMTYDTLDTLLHAAECYEFREILLSETQDEYRNALADHVHTVSPIAGHEIRTGRGWDEWSQEDKEAFLNITLLRGYTHVRNP